MIFPPLNITKCKIRSQVFYNVKIYKGVIILPMSKKDIHLTITQAATFLGISKEEMKKIVDAKKLIKYGDNGYRYLLSMREINRLK